MPKRTKVEREQTLSAMRCLQKNTVKHVNEQSQMDSKQIEQMEKDDPSEETLELTNCLKELTIP